MAIFVLFSVLSPKRRLLRAGGRGFPAAAYRRTPSCPASWGPQTLVRPLSEQKLFISELDTHSVHFYCMNCNTYPVFIKTEMIVRFYMSPWMFLNIT
jgi:hypothetical protein